MSFRGCAAISLSFIVLSLLLLSFTFVNIIIPKAEPSRFTGYPTWHTVFDRLYYYYFYYFLIKKKKNYNLFKKKFFFLNRF